MNVNGIWKRFNQATILWALTTKEQLPSKPPSLWLRESRILGEKTVSMEIEGENGSRTQLREGSEIVFGRGNGFNPNDPTVSRRHISFELTTPRVSFQAIGKNPIWVRAKESGEIRAFRRFERGELSVGDLFCVSSTDPVWFSVKKAEDNEGEIGASSCEEGRELGDELESEVSSESELTGNAQDLDLGFDSIDISNIDPVEEFGFLVIGHEFDNYPKAKIRDVKRWNWFLEDRREASTDDEDDTDHDKGKKGLSRKRKKKNDRDEDDEEWTGESEEGEEALAKSRRFSAPKYSTRSKDLGRGRPKKDSTTPKGSKRADEEDEDDEEEEEGDETLGGFIVGDDDDAEGEAADEDEDENEEEEDEFED